METKIEQMRLVDGCMTNFDWTIDHGVVDTLRAKPNKVYVQYAGWNFCGYVWWDGQQFCCEVWQFNQPIDEICASTLEEIMERVSAEYGHE